MYTTYHFDSAADINSDLLKSIKAVFKGKAVVITVEEEQDETAFLMNNPINKAMLLKSVEQDKNGEFIPFSLPDA